MNAGALALYTPENLLVTVVKQHHLPGYSVVRDAKNKKADHRAVRDVLLAQATAGSSSDGVEFGQDEVPYVGGDLLTSDLAGSIYHVAKAACVPRNVTSSDKTPTLALLRPETVRQKDCIKSAAPTVNHVWMHAVEVVGQSHSRTFTREEYKGTDHAYRLTTPLDEEYVIWFRTSRPNNAQAKAWKIIRDDFKAKYPQATVIVSPFDHAKFTDYSDLFTHSVTDTWSVIGGTQQMYWYVWALFKAASLSYHREAA